MHVQTPGLAALSESESLYYKRKLSRLRAVGQHVALLCSSTGILSHAESDELDLCVRTLVSDLRDLELVLGHVPPPLVPLNNGGMPQALLPGGDASSTELSASSSSADAGLHIGPIVFPAFGPPGATRRNSGGAFASAGSPVMTRAIPTVFPPTVGSGAFGVGPTGFTMPPYTAPTSTAVAPASPIGSFSNGSAFSGDRDSFHASKGPWDFSMPVVVAAQAPVVSHVKVQRPAALNAAKPYMVPDEDSSADDQRADADDMYDDGDAMFDGSGSSAPRVRRPAVRRKTAASDKPPSGAKRKARGPKGMIDNPVCGHCNTTVTPEWRSGPNGLLLCNACGLKWSRKRAKPEGSGKK